MRFVSLALLVAATGCRSVLGIEDVTVAVDASNDLDAQDAEMPDAAPDGGPACYGTFQSICLAQPPSADVSLPGGAFNTNTSPLCSGTATSSTPLCVVAGRSITIPVGVTISLTGAVPLVLVATESIIVAGTLDGASTSLKQGPGSSTVCATVVSAGGAGGPGGSFGGRGGSGGNGPTGAGQASAPSVMPTTFIGGCSGQVGGNTGGGVGGQPGGALGLIAPEIRIAGRINVSGAAGRGGGPADGGGGGGGSGGLLILDTAALDLMSSSVLIANGGGGAEGAGNTVGGNPGSDPSLTAPTSAAQGGDGGSGGGGGGNGAAVTAATAGQSDATSGGGGGGGGAGIIRTTDPTPPVGATTGIRSPPFS